jgi:dihydrolipoamide dehydrogenase
MTEANEHDIAIIGGGPGGYVAALRAAQLGASVVLVEKDRLGGTCLNRGCIPTKALVRSVEAVEEVRNAAEFGVDVSGFSINFSRMMERKREVVDGLVAGIEQLMQAGKVEVRNGLGQILTPRRIRVNDEEISAKNIIVASGSVPARIPIPGLDLPGVVTSDELLEIDHIPSSLVVIGGGVIGMEFAGIFSHLGTEVTVIEMLPQILPPVDDEIARRFSLLLRQQNISVNINARVKEVRQGEGNLNVVFEQKGEDKTLETEMVLVAVGRSPYTEGLGLESLGVEMNRRAIAVNDRMETNIPGISAIGDVNGVIMLAHVASYQGEIAVENALGKNRRADYRYVPNCIFTLPEIAAAGLTERQAKDEGLSYKVSRFPFSALGRAQAMGETAGLVKMICDADNGAVLGINIMGPHATDLIAEGVAIMQLEGSAEDVVHTIHAHPTLPEAMAEAAMGQFEGPLHQLKR